MVEKVRKFTVADLYSEAAKMVREEMSGITKKPITAEEEVKLKELAKVISKTVLKEMKIA
jgi:hypothetical protein